MKDLFSPEHVGTCFVADSPAATSAGWRPS